MANKLPLIISNPHAGLSVPKEIANNCLLNLSDIIKDSDEQAKSIYQPLKNLCQGYVEADIARAFVDLNRPVDDFSKDGVVKTHTCWDEPIYRTPLALNQIQTLLTKYHEPYHHQLSELVESGHFKCLIDCHTMADFAPITTATPGKKRPLVCLSNSFGSSCPAPIFCDIVVELRKIFGEQFNVNKPFHGGFICTYFGQFIPTVQLEVSRTLAVSVDIKSRLIHKAIKQISVVLGCYC